MQINILKTLALCVAACSAIAADQGPASPTAGDVALEMISARPRAYANVCIAKDPTTKKAFDSALADLKARVETIGRPLLASAQFSSLNQTPAPQELIEAARDQNSDLERQIAGTDAARDCPVFLANIARIAGATLRGGIEQVLAGIQQTLIAMKEEAARRP